jgi:hypothetical protein
MYWLPAGFIRQWCDRASVYVCLSNKRLKAEQWSSDLSLSCTLTKHCDIQNENTGFKTSSLSPLTTIHIDLADSSVLPLLFLRSLSILSGCPITNTHSCNEDRKLSWVGPMEYRPHTGFHYCILLIYLACDIAALSVFEAKIWMVVVIGKFLIDLRVRNILYTKLHGLGAC